MIHDVTFILLLLSIFANLAILGLILKSKDTSQIKKVFICNLLCLLICTIGQASQILLSEKLQIPPIYFDYFVYIGTCLLPVSVFFTGLIFVYTKIKFKYKYLLLFIIPIISLLILWTNDFHHLFYKNYSIDYYTNEYGSYFTVHNIYSYVLMFFGIKYLLTASIKNSSFFSKQSLLILIGILIPLVINIMGTLQIIPMTIYYTPIAFTVTIVCIFLAIYKFKFLKIVPIALQRIVDRMSDSYIVIDDSYKIVDFNQPFVKATEINASTLRNHDVYDLLVNISDIDFTKEELTSAFETVKKDTTKTVVLEKNTIKTGRYYNVEISSISSDNSIIGILILFKDITQHVQDMQTIKSSQDILIERERLASLGQMIGGIAHNLKTPIMSIAGAAEGLTDLIKEYDSSIGDKDVTEADHHDIAKDMQTWVDKVKEYTSYMSDVITAVKGQAVTLSETQSDNFTVEELVKRVNILMKHELKNALVTLNLDIQVDQSTQLKGNVNSLVQVINNMISNAIQAYNGEPNKDIDMTIFDKNSE